MDFDLDDRQRTLLATVDAVVTDSGRERAYAVSAQGGYDGDLDRSLYAALAGRALNLLDRVLVADRLAELGCATTTGLALALDAARTDTAADTGGGVTVVGPTGLARFGADAETAVVESDGGVRAVRLGSSAGQPVRSGFGFPYARIERARLGAAPVVCVLDPARWPEVIVLIRSAELAGAAAAAVARTGEHLRGRHQFGQPLANFQALRHRLAEAAVSADATRWLVREAAYTRAPRDIAIAAQYAQQTAATLVPELVQLGGARSFAREFGLHVNPMRLEALRLELGRPDRLAAAVNTAPLAAGVGNGR